MSPAYAMKKSGKKAKKDAGKKKQPREKASKPAAGASAEDPGYGAREETESSDARSADSSATILTSSSLREPERAVVNAPSASTASMPAMEAGVKGAGSEVLPLCARCQRKLHGGKRRRNRSPLVDVRQGLLERSDSNWKVWLYPAVAIILSLAVVSGVYMMMGAGGADSSEEPDDVQRKQEAFPEFLCPCNTSGSTSATGSAFTDNIVLSDVLHHRRRFVTATVKVPPKSTVRGGRRRSAVPKEAENRTKRRKTRRRGLQDTDHNDTLASEKKLPGTTLQGHVGHKIVPARKRASTKTTLPALHHTASSKLRTKRNALKTLGVGGKTTQGSGKQRSKSVLKASPLPRGTKDKKGSAKAPFLKRKTGRNPATDWEDAELSQSPTTDDSTEEVYEVGAAY